MSLEYHDNVRHGETWSFVVTLTDADGAPLVPDELTFRLWDWAGNELTKTLDSGITLSGTAGNVATITLPTYETDDLAARLHRHELVAVKNGAVSRELHGTLGVLA
jgi:hypothetical protein